MIGAAGIALSILGIIDPANANPSAFLVGLLWLTVLSGRFTIKPITDPAMASIANGGTYDASTAG